MVMTKSYRKHLLLQVENKGDLQEALRSMIMETAVHAVRVSEGFDAYGHEAGYFGAFRREGCSPLSGVDGHFHSGRCWKCPLAMLGEQGHSSRCVRGDAAKTRSPEEIKEEHDG